MSEVEDDAVGEEPLDGQLVYLPGLERPGGSIVNVGSLAALTGHYTVAYTASKWALRGLARVASMELGPRRIRVNTIHPGYIQTSMTASAPAAFLEANNAAGTWRYRRRSSAAGCVPRLGRVLFYQRGKDPG